MLSDSDADLPITDGNKLDLVTYLSNELARRARLHAFR